MRLRHLLTAQYESSVVRRTIVLLALVVPAFAANFLVLYVCAAWLSPFQFGIFYAANAIGNILYSGSLVLNLYFTRYLVSIQTTHGAAYLSTGVFGIQRFVVGWGAVIGAALVAIGVIAGHRLGVQSWLIVMLIVLDAYTAYIGDLGRVLLQSSRRTILLGTYTLVWMTLRLVLCIVGVLVFRTVWGALTGVVTSSLIIIAGLNLWLLHGKRSPRQATVEPLPPIAGEFPAILSYSLLVAIANLDILLGYFLLPNIEFGAYSASSVLPKAILVVIMPLQQMLFPMMTGGSGKRADAIIGLKSVGIVLFIAAAGVAATQLLSPALCGAPPGLVICVPPLMSVMLWSVVPLALVRALMLGDFARQRYLRVVWLLVPCVGYVVWAIEQHAAIREIAWGYVACSIGGLVLLTVTGPLRAGVQLIWGQGGARHVSNAGQTPG